MARHVCEWATSGGERRNTAAYDKGISLGVCRTILGVSVNDRGLNFLVRARSAARLLGGSAGSAGCQLTDPVAETPDVDLRRSAASHHQAELGGRCPRGAEANPGVWSKQSSRKKSYYRKTRPRPGVCATSGSLKPRHEMWDDGYTSKGVAVRHTAVARTPMTSPSNLPSQHSAPTAGPTGPPRPRCRIRCALRLRPSAEAPHGRATTALRRGFVPVGAIAVGGCGSRAEPSIRARTGCKAGKYIERRLNNAVSVTSVSASSLNGA